MGYPGGKGGASVYQAIINEQPPHDIYIEPFLGGGSVLRNKRPASRSIGVDLSCETVAAWADVHGVEVIHGCDIDFLDRFRWTGRKLIYVDSPYVRSSRRSVRDLYEHELTDADHERLLAVLLGSPCMVQVSGYWSELYVERLADWRRTEYQAPTRGGRPATEYLRMNYPPPVALQDYSFLGGDFRERERIKWKALRWSAGLARLPDLERQAVLSAMLAGTHRQI